MIKSNLAIFDCLQLLNLYVNRAKIINILAKKLYKASSTYSPKINTVIYKA